MKNSIENIPKNSSLILGFFDGVHAGHLDVISSAVNFAKKNNAKTILVTLKESPSIYFDKFEGYIYPRETSYELIKSAGVDYIYEQDFKELVSTSANDYLEFLINSFQPISISSGENHTFGKDRLGTSSFLEENQNKYSYKYLCSPTKKIGNTIVSSTSIRKFIKTGEIEKANKFLTFPYFIKGTVIHGRELGQKIGFPTANLIYQKELTELPFGVYKVDFEGKIAVANWGIKPTIGNSNKTLEVHIPNFDANLYDKEICVSFIKKLRDEKKFNSIEDLKTQIKKDIELCLES